MLDQMIFVYHNDIFIVNVSGNFWTGLDPIYHVTNNRPHKLSAYISFREDGILVSRTYSYKNFQVLNGRTLIWIYTPLICGVNNNHMKIFTVIPGQTVSCIAPHKSEINQTFITNFLSNIVYLHSCMSSFLFVVEHFSS